MTDELIRKEWLQLFYKNELFIIHKEYKKELEIWLDEHRTSIHYLKRKYGDSLVK